MMGGGGKGGGGSTFNPYEYMSANLANTLFQETAPTRNLLEGSLNQFLSTGVTPTLFSPVYAAGKDAIEKQYGVAKDQLMSGSPKGGTVGDALAQLESGRASDLVNLKSGIASDLFSKAYGMAYSTPQTSIAGLSGAGQSFATQQAAQSASAGNAKSGKAGGLGMLGQGAGSMLGRIFGGDISHVPIEAVWQARHVLRPE
jgi:hypothetical protein